MSEWERRGQWVVRAGQVGEDGYRACLMLPSAHGEIILCATVPAGALRALRQQLALAAHPGVGSARPALWTVGEEVGLSTLGALAPGIRAARRSHGQLVERLRRARRASGGVMQHLPPVALLRGIGRLFRRRRPGVVGDLVGHIADLDAAGCCVGAGEELSGEWGSVEGADDGVGWSEVGWDRSDWRVGDEVGIIPIPPQAMQLAQDLARRGLRAASNLARTLGRGALRAGRRAVQSIGRLFRRRRRPAPQPPRPQAPAPQQAPPPPSMMADAAPPERAPYRAPPAARAAPPPVVDAEPVDPQPPSGGGAVPEGPALDDGAPPALPGLTEQLAQLASGEAEAEDVAPYLATAGTLAEGVGLVGEGTEAAWGQVRQPVAGLLRTALRVADARAAESLGDPLARQQLARARQSTEARVANAIRMVDLMLAQGA